MMDEVTAISQRSARSPVAAAGHAEGVYSIAEGATPPSSLENVSSSWQRSANEHGVDPADSTAPRILTTGELKPLREPLDELVFSAQEEIDQLYRVVREAGYTILFCDRSRASQSSIAANARRHPVSNIGERGSAACGPRK